MEFEKIVENAWFKIVEDFENAKKNGEAWLWTEATMRLNFLRRMCESVKLGRVLAETPFHIGDIDHKPDIVADIIINNDINTIAFEMKFFGKIADWKKDLDKIEKYGLISWEYGYFLAIGTAEQCEEIKKEPLKQNPPYKIKVLTHSTPYITIPPYFKYAEYVLKESLGKDIAYVVNELYGAVAIYEEYSLFFDLSAKEEKLVVWAHLSDELLGEQKIREMGFVSITFDEKGKMQLSDVFTGQILIGEFEVANVKEVAKNINEALNRFKEKMKHLYGPQKLT